MCSNATLTKQILNFVRCGVYLTPKYTLINRTDLDSTQIQLFGFEIMKKFPKGQEFSFQTVILLWS